VKPASRHFIQDRMLEALREAARKGQAVPDNVLQEIAYKGLKPVTLNAFHKELSRLNQRLAAEGHGVIAQSTVSRRLYDANDVLPRTRK